MENDDLPLLAHEFRKQKGLSTDEAIDLRSLLLKLNVITLFTGLSEGFCGMAIKNNQYKFMLINSNHALGKQNFTICHEIYHLFIQEDFTYMFESGVGKFDKSNKIEYAADNFAANLLLPEYGIKALIPADEGKKNQITLTTLLKIEHYYGCSRNALLYRLKLMGLIDATHFERYNHNIQKGAREYGYPTELYKGTKENNSIGDFGGIIKYCFDNEIISESHYISLMRDIGIDEENCEPLKA